MVAVPSARIASPGITITARRVPVVLWLAWVGFFVGLALYQLPDTRLAVDTTRVPFFALFALALAPFAVGPSPRQVFGRLWPGILVLCGLLVATALSGMAHPDQDWLEGGKRVAYVLTGLVVVRIAIERPALFSVGLAAYALTAGAMAVYGFVLLGQGFGQASQFFYFGLHYTASTRNGDAFFIILPMFAALGLSATGQTPRLLRIISAGAFVLLAAGVLLSFSRGAWLAVGVGLVVLFLLAEGRRIPLAALLIGLFAFAIVALPYLAPAPVRQLLADRAASITAVSDAGGNSNLERLRLLQDTADLITLNPLTGIGVGRIGDALYHMPESFGLGHAENSYLTVWAEYGPLGFIVVLGLACWPLVRLWPRRGRPKDYLRVALWCGALAIALNGLANDSVASAFYWVMPMFLVAYS